MANLLTTICLHNGMDVVVSVHFSTNPYQVSSTNTKDNVFQIVILTVFKLMLYCLFESFFPKRL